MWRLGCLSLLAAGVAILLHVWLMRENQVKSRLSCSDRNQPEKSVCYGENICYSKLDNGRHVIYAYNLENMDTASWQHPIAYLVATDVFPQSALYLRPVQKVISHSMFPQSKSHMLTRFKPDNIMHVLHDDILPTYAVLMKMFPDQSHPYPITLVFADEYDEMPYDDLYQTLSLYPIIYGAYKSQCYRQLSIGSDRSTLWYQYGFTKPQGPVPHDKERVVSIINSFARTKHRENLNKLKHITLFSRTETRLILNEAELSISLVRKFSRSVKTVDLSTHSIWELIDIVSSSFLIIGMHGSMFSTMIWFPRNATVLELFPYAINPTMYTPYRTLAGILGINYLSWTNGHMRNTVGHADYPQYLGGLEHLSYDKRKEIISQTDVKPHLCCDDSSWLYHIYQDTVVDVEEILLMLRNVEPPPKV